MMIDVRGHKLPFSFTNVDRIKAYTDAYANIDADVAAGLKDIAAYKSLDDMVGVLESLYKALDTFFASQFWALPLPLSEQTELGELEELLLGGGDLTEYQERRRANG